MPLYRYFCMDCEQEQTIIHTMQQTDVNCVHCGSQKLKKIFKTFSVSNKDHNISTGDLVKEYIENSKEDLRQHRRELKEREYE